MTKYLMTENKLKIAYIHTVKYPSVQANALQAIKTASALSTKVDTTFFMPALGISKAKLKQKYDVNESQLRLQSMYLDKLRFLTCTATSRVNNFFGKSLSLYFRNNPQWTKYKGQKVLFVRVTSEMLFWGLQREHSRWLQDWIFIFEAHDALGFDAAECKNVNPFDLKDGTEGRYRRSLLKALQNFDRVVCVTQPLADDLCSWTGGSVCPHVIRQASSIPRVGVAPQVSFGEEIVLGYIGTIDQFRGINVLLEAMKYLPQNYKLRLIGRLREERNVDMSWFGNYLKNPLIKSKVEYIPQIPIKDVAGEIDRCDILIQPASTNSVLERYASPLKAYDPLMRGKPIIAADTPGLRDLYANGEWASFYHIEPHCLAKSIINLVDHPEQAERIALVGWEQGIEFTYLHRAEKIITLVEECQKNLTNSQING